MLIADLINNYAQQKTATVEYFFGSHNDLEIRAEHNGNLERPEVSKIEDGVCCQRRCKYQRSCATICCGRML